MTKEQIEDLDRFIEGLPDNKERIFLKYLKAYDWLIQDKLPKMKKYVSEAELKVDAIFAIELTFERAYHLILNDGWHPERIDLLHIFKGFFFRTSRQNKRDNLPMRKETRDEIIY